MEVFVSKRYKFEESPAQQRNQDAQILPGHIACWSDGGREGGRTEGGREGERREGGREGEREREGACKIGEH